VTAEEWEACRDPRRMLRALRERGALTRRKALWFACGCCRRIWCLIGDERGRQAVVAAERCADGGHPDGTLPQLIERARAASREAFVDDGPAEALDAALNVALAAASLGDVATEAEEVADSASNAVEDAVGVPYRDEVARCSLREGEETAKATLARCIFGNPSHPFTVNPAVLPHNDGAAVKLATVSYNERDPETGLLDATGLAILADALEEAGVDDSAALAHLRGPGPHCRGCHVVDAVLGRG
jgi:hypothetical protein